MGDLLILATDGFFDNIFKETAVKVVTSMAGSSSAEIAEPRLTAQRRPFGPAFW